MMHHNLHGKSHSSNLTYDDNKDDSKLQWSTALHNALYIMQLCFRTSLCTASSLSCHHNTAHICC